jgi:hypothetical protein
MNSPNFACPAFSEVERLSRASGLFPTSLPRRTLGAWWSARCPKSRSPGGGAQGFVVRCLEDRAWEAWCYENGEEPGKQNSFTRVMGERGAVKNFHEGIWQGQRLWKRIGVKSAPDPDPKRGVEQIDVDEKRGVEQPEIEEKGAENVGESAPDTPSLDKSAPAQKSCKHGGVAGSEVHFSENGGNFSPETLRVDSFAETEPPQKVHLNGKSAPDGVTTPLRWSEDGVEWEYVPVEESE